jgi:hypothetical protein
MWTKPEISVLLSIVKDVKSGPNVRTNEQWITDADTGDFIAPFASPGA